MGRPVVVAGREAASAVGAIDAWEPSQVVVWNRYHLVGVAFHTLLVTPHNVTSRHVFRGASPQT
jgi:hypothetical protein